MIEIKTLNKKTLLEYINSAGFGAGPDIPISVHRALSQIKNPRLDENDVILLLAYDDGVLVGYLGILPDTVFRKGKGLEKIGWLSCLWVSQHVRRRGISVELMSKSLELWNNHVLAADYVPFTKKIYDRTNQFVDTPYTKRGIRLYVKSDLHTILPPKGNIFQRLKGLLKAIDFCVNGILNVRLKLFAEDFSPLHFEYINSIDEEVNDFISAKQEKQPFRRNKDDLNWIVQNPWIIPANQKDDLNRKYYFSSTAKSFDFYLLKVRNSDQKLIAFLMFAKREDRLKLPYLYHDNCLDTIVKVINCRLVKWGNKNIYNLSSGTGQTPEGYEKSGRIEAGTDSKLYRFVGLQRRNI